MSEMRYPAVICQDPKGNDWVVTFPDLEGAITGGATFDEALDEAADCLASWLAFALAERREIPEPSKATAKQRSIPVPLWIAPKIALFNTMREQNISNSELARRLDVNETVVRRMLDPGHATTSKKLESALRAVGQSVYLVTAA